MNHRLAIALGLGFVSGVFAPSFVACTVPDPNHCVNNGGDDYCEAQHPDGDKPYCSDNTCVDTPSSDGCQAEIPDGCHYCNGGDAMECSESSSGDGDGDPTGDGDGDMSGDGDGEMTGDGDGDGDTPQCMSSSECADPMMPLCDDGACVACGDAAVASCAADYPETPVCAGDGQCVECTEEDTSVCGADTPACVDNVCVPCTEHEQCPASACRLDEGTCFGSGAVWHVDGDNNDCDGADGSEGAPFCTIGEGVAMVGAGQSGVVLVHEIDGDGNYSENVTIDEGAVVALVGAGGENPVWGFAANNLLRVLDENTQVFVHQMTLANAGASSIAASIGGSAWVTKCVLVNSMGNVVEIAGGNIHMHSSFVGGNLTDQSAISIGAGSVDIAYSTLTSGFGNSAGISCAGAGESVSVTNSIIVSRDAVSDEISGCMSGDFTGSATESGLLGTTTLGEFDLSWFEDFATGDFHLTDMAPAELATAAAWQEGDPRTDIDGDPRPTEAGSADYAGADIP